MIKEKLEQGGEKINLEDIHSRVAILYDNEDNIDIILEHARTLIKNFDNFNDYRLYHILVGSTEWNPKEFPGDNYIEDDFPGEEYSVIKLIEKLENNQKIK